MWKAWWPTSLAGQFLVIGGGLTLVAMLHVGFAVTRLLEDAVTRNSGAATAMYVDSIIAPLLPDLRTTSELPDSVETALDETLSQGALRDRLLAFHLWRGDGTILYSNIKSLQGRRFPVHPSLKEAVAGRMVAKYEQPSDEAAVDEPHRGVPALEIYNPVLQPWSGEVIAVTEFYERADDFERTLSSTRMRSLLVIASFALVFFAALSTIVIRASRLIERQKQVLEERVTDLQALLAENGRLQDRVGQASRSAIAFNESNLRRIGADLHDGPAQLIAFAALRLDSKPVNDARTRAAERRAELSTIRAILGRALDEIRAICRGLVLPEIEHDRIDMVVRHAVQAHEQRTASKVVLSLEPTALPVSDAVKLCAYRFVQEGLQNAFRHAAGKEQRVTQTVRNGVLGIVVADGGSGFDPKAPTGRLGLAGLRNRVESLGGTFETLSGHSGTTLAMTLPLTPQEVQ